MLRPMSEAKKDGQPILAAFRRDIETRSERAKHLAGRFVVIRHPGVADDGFDMGWNLAGPWGHGGFPDDWFAGWQELPEYSEGR